jgi:hypothetical protein
MDAADAGYWCQHCRVPASKLVEVEYVPRSALAGAVGALADALAAFDLARGDEKLARQAALVDEVRKLANRYGEQ